MLSLAYNHFLSSYHQRNVCPRGKVVVLKTRTSNMKTQINTAMKLCRYLKKKHKKKYWSLDVIATTVWNICNLRKKSPWQSKNTWSPEKGVSHQEWQEVSDPSAMPSFYQLTTEGKPCQRSRCQHTGFFNCSALRKFWHFFDGIYWVIWHFEL